MPDKNQEPDVEIINDETLDQTQDQPSDVTVDLDAKPAQKQVDQTKPEPTQKPADSRLQNTIAYQTRQLERAMRELQQTKAEIQALRERSETQVKAPEVTDEIDEIAQRDWKQGVKKVVEKDIEAKVQEILTKRDKAQEEITRRRASESELEKSKQRVLQKYPDLDSDESEEASVYRQVLTEDNSLLSNIHGPEIAMYRMEERLREMGRTPATVKPIVDREVQRLARAGASSVIGRQMSQNGKITLTKEQKEFCEHYNIPFAEYAKNLKAQSVREGVEA